MALLLLTMMNIDLLLLPKIKLAPFLLLPKKKMALLLLLPKMKTNGQSEIHVLSVFISFKHSIFE